MDFKKYTITGETKFSIKSFHTEDTGEFSEKKEVQGLSQENLKQMDDYQNKLYAEGKNGILVIFQAMDAAGKDGAIRHVFSGLNPQGVDVNNFKQPSAEELMHDYLWRTAINLPKLGKIAIFNRSYYEDVLIAKVHKLYEGYNLPDRCKTERAFEQRYTQIKNFEDYLWENGIMVIKFFLHISKDTQKKRFLERIDDKSKNWKFSESDILERKYWEDYQNAYEKAINETATEHSPWYVIPSDQKWYARYLISEIFVDHLKKLDPQYPKLSKEAAGELGESRKKLLQ
jgi:PPK2 family polyphosphate:nucleotide phosphotransferase